MPFREAHRVVGRLVRDSLEQGRALTELNLEDLRAHSADFGEDALSLLDVRRSLARRNIEGGTGPQAVAEQMEKAQQAWAGS